MRTLSYLDTGGKAENLETRREHADSALGIEPTTILLPHLQLFSYASSIRTWLATPLMCGAPGPGCVLRWGCGSPPGWSLGVCYQRANAHSLCIRPLLSGRMKLMRFQFGFAVNRGTICKQMTELRESGHVCSWILTEVHPSLQTTANNKETSTD